MPAIAIAISRCAASVSATNASRRHVAAILVALTAATTSISAASASRIQAGVIGPRSPQLR